MINKIKSHETPTPSIQTAEAEAASLDLQVRLEKVSKMAGVLGYIRRNDSTAAVNLRGTEGVQEFALLSSEAFDAMRQLTDVYGLSGVSDFVVECQTFLMLCICRGSEAISVFMSKSADVSSIKTELLST
jgi:hypothetical protein